MGKKLLLIALVIFAAFQWGGYEPEPIVQDGEVFLYRAVEKVSPGHFPLNQGNYGSCVAFGHAAACDILLAIDKDAGRASQWVPSSPDSIYGGSRCEAYDRTYNRGGQGSNGYGATTWLNEKGGVLYQKPYGRIDLTKYDIPRTANWGAHSNGGDNSLKGELDEEARKNPIKQVALVRTLEELDTALKNGFPVTICSGQGFTKVRDKDGFCRPYGSWAHCMCIVGKRDGGRKGYLILNSWGEYLSGGKYKDQPEGSFYAEPDVVLRILRAGDSWALSGQSAFMRRPLPFWMTSADAEIPNDPVTVPDDRDSKVYMGVDNQWHFYENGKDYVYKNGSWYQCSAGVCLRCR